MLPPERVKVRVPVPLGTSMNAEPFVTTKASRVKRWAPETDGWGKTWKIA
jgi:hypothetical protein